MKNRNEDKVEITIKQDYFDRFLKNHQFILLTSNLFILWFIVLSKRRVCEMQ